jgi:hypothetical protein
MLAEVGDKFQYYGKGGAIMESVLGGGNEYPVRVYDLFFSPSVGGYVSRYPNLKVAEVRALAVLHELAHLFNKGHGTSKAGNYAHTKQIYDACFK